MSYVFNHVQIRCSHLLGHVVR